MAARRFLSGDTWLLQLWCRWLNIHPDRIRAAAGRRGWSEGVGRSFEDRSTAPPKSESKKRKGPEILGALSA